MELKSLKRGIATEIEFKEYESERLYIYYLNQLYNYLNNHLSDYQFIRNQFLLQDFKELLAYITLPNE